jgi:hypothetical protein
VLAQFTTKKLLHNKYISKLTVGDDGHSTKTQIVHLIENKNGIRNLVLPLGKHPDVCSAIGTITKYRLIALLDKILQVDVQKFRCVTQMSRLLS